VVSAGQARKPLVAADAVGLVVGIIIGAGIFQTPAKVCAAMGSPCAALWLWIGGALAALCGALCYAELAAAYPTDAGEAEYFARAFGPFFGWFFTWVQLVCFRTAAAIVSIAYVFADHARELAAGPTWLLVGGAIVVLTGVNALGLRPGKWTQNTLAAVKVTGLTAVVLAGLLATAPDQPAVTRNSAPLALAVVMIMYAYSGWHEAAYIVGDLRDPSRSLPRAMSFGVGAVTAVYLAVNLAALHALGFDGLRDLADRGEGFGVPLFHRAGIPGALFAVLVVIVTLGSTNGTILSGSRLFAAVGEKQPGYGWLSKARTKRDAPLAALFIQAAICLAFVAVIELTGATRKDQQGQSGFDRVVAATSPVLWLVFFGAGLAIFVLRGKEPDRPRPFRVPLYPLVPAVYLAACVFMLYESIAYALANIGPEFWLTVGLLALGMPYRWVTARDAASERR
jgi:amino acid transporter